MVKADDVHTCFWAMSIQGMYWLPKTNSSHHPHPHDGKVGALATTEQPSTYPFFFFLGGGGCVCTTSCQRSAPAPSFRSPQVVSAVKGKSFLTSLGIQELYQLSTATDQFRGNHYLTFQKGWTEHSFSSPILFSGLTQLSGTEIRTVRWTFSASISDTCTSCFNC